MPSCHEANADWAQYVATDELERLDLDLEEEIDEDGLKAIMTDRAGRFPLQEDTPPNNEITVDAIMDMEMEELIDNIKTSAVWLAQDNMDGDTDGEFENAQNRANELFESDEDTEDIVFEGVESNHGSGTETSEDSNESGEDTEDSDDPEPQQKKAKNLAQLVSRISNKLLEKAPKKAIQSLAQYGERVDDDHKARKILACLGIDDEDIALPLHNRTDHKKFYDNIENKFGFETANKVQAICRDIKEKYTQKGKTTPQFRKMLTRSGLGRVLLPEKAFELKKYVQSGGRSELILATLEDIFVKGKTLTEKDRCLALFLNKIGFWDREAEEAKKDPASAFSAAIAKSIEKNGIFKTWNCLVSTFDDEVIESELDVAHFLSTLKTRIGGLVPDQKGRGKDPKGRSRKGRGKTWWSAGNDNGADRDNGDDDDGDDGAPGKGAGKGKGKNPVCLRIKHRTTGQTVDLKLPTGICWSHANGTCQKPGCRVPHKDWNKIVEEHEKCPDRFRARDWKKVGRTPN